MSAIILVVICSFLYTEGLAPLELLVGLAFLGSVAGDQTGFYFGRWIGPGLHHTKFAERHAVRIANAEAMVRKWGWGAIMIGRFLPALRSIIPAMCGISGFQRLRYLMFDVIACGLWATGLTLILKGVDSVTG